MTQPSKEGQKRIARANSQSFWHIFLENAGRFKGDTLKLLEVPKAQWYRGPFEKEGAADGVTAIGR